MLLLSVGIPGLREEGNGIVRCQHAWPEALGFRGLGFKGLGFLNEEEAYFYISTADGDDDDDDDEEDGDGDGDEEEEEEEERGG